MPDRRGGRAAAASSLTLVVRRIIAASPERLFEAWTRPEHLIQWWGPSSVTCCHAEVDLSLGGRYRIGNRFADGRIVWISGEFEAIEPPRRLVYTWQLEGGLSERVAVTFTARSQGTEVAVTHERIPDPTVRDRHEQGWIGCLDKLAHHLSGRK